MWVLFAVETLPAPHPNPQPKRSIVGFGGGGGPRIPKPPKSSGSNWSVCRACSVGVVWCRFRVEALNPHAKERDAPSATDTHAPLWLLDTAHLGPRFLCFCFLFFVFLRSYFVLI